MWKGTSKKAEPSVKLYVLRWHYLIIQGKRHPLTCTKTSSLEEVISDMLFNHIHQLFIVDEANMPLGVVSYADIIQDIVQ